MLSIPLKVHGISTDGDTFAVETKSHTISLHGASLELEYPVQLGDILMVENAGTHEQTEARVATIKKTREGKVHVGLEFTSKDVNFWHMAFPGSRRETDAPPHRQSRASRRRPRLRPPSKIPRDFRPQNFREHSSPSCRGGLAPPGVRFTSKSDNRRESMRVFIRTAFLRRDIVCV